MLVGKEKPVSEALAAGAAGAIWAMANVSAPALRRVFDLHHRGEDMAGAQAALDTEAKWLDGLPKLPALKSVLRLRGVIGSDAILPPLSCLEPSHQADLEQRLHRRGGAH